MIDLILLDMDGVLSNICDALGRLHNIPVEKRYGTYNMETLTDLSYEEFWSLVAAEGFAFWEDIRPFSWTKELYRLAKDFCPNVFICSTPLYSGSSAAGKIEWLNKHLHNPFRNYILTPHKYLLAKPSAVLIDDCDSQTVKFAAAGGLAITFPWPYNCNHASTDDDRLEFVENALRNHSRSPALCK